MPRRWSQAPLSTGTGRFGGRAYGSLATPMFFLLSLLKIPSGLSLLGFRACPGDTPCLTSGREATPREAPVSILRVILLLLRALFRDRSGPPAASGSRPLLHRFIA